jgi:LmbE family N-acetylglucosaminyl deacetylase
LQGYERLFVLAPHPDDEALGAGGIIYRAARAGLPVRLVFLTNGDGSQSTRLAAKLRRPQRYPNTPETFLQLAEMRQREVLASAAVLGLSPEDTVFLGYPDGGTRAMWERHRDGQSLYRSAHTKCNRSPYHNSRTPQAPYSASGALEDVIGAIADFKPTIVMTTHAMDTHSDHRTSFELCRAALAHLRGSPAEGKWAMECRFYTFLVHYGVWPVPSHYRPELYLAPPAALRGPQHNWLTLPLGPDECAAKRAALECYRSQLKITPRYLRSFLRRNELFDAVGVAGNLPWGRTGDAAHR